MFASVHSRFPNADRRHAVVEKVYDDNRASAHIIVIFFVC